VVIPVFFPYVYIVCAYQRVLNIVKMQKLSGFLLAIIFGSKIIAGPVSLPVARDFSERFYSTISSKVIDTATLAFTEISDAGDSLYFVFDINVNDGFVIVAADNAAHPVIGYSSQGKFVIPSPASATDAWMKKRGNEILQIRSNAVQADAMINKEWMVVARSNKSTKNTTLSTFGVNPLVSTTWNQNPYYNSLCPGTGSNQAVTGCVATAMAQILKFWNYPPHGTDSSSYCDCKKNGDSIQYGILSANYATTTYNWDNMPLNLSTYNSDIATLMLQCGISVQMDYAPSGSGAWVITADDSICAQRSYVKYFGYNPSTIQGLRKSGYSDTNWVVLLENELNDGRPVQYVGDDPTYGGHTWVCDGYDQYSNFHMNWGWGGQDDGFYAINALNPVIYDFKKNEEALIGIEPLIKQANDAGIASVISPSAAGNCNNTITPEITLKNFGRTTLSSCILNYTIDGGSIQTQNWSGSISAASSVEVSLASFTTTPGVHTLCSYSSMPNGLVDGNKSNDTIRVTFYDNSIGSSLPVFEGFEGLSNLPSGWTLYNPNYDVAWSGINGVSFAGSQCIGFNNCNGDGNTSMAGTIDRLITTAYDFSGGLAGNISFEVAYAPCSFNNGSLFTDTLAVYYSTNCGENWNRFYLKGGATLATAATFTGTGETCWTPSGSNEWRMESADVAEVAGQSSVMFAFENRSDFGQWIYIDNINISGSSSTTGITQFGSGKQQLMVYPNPANGSFTVSGTGHTGRVNFTILDVSGRTVSAGNMNIEGDGFKSTLQVNDLAKGMYYLKVYDDQDSWINKLVIQ
jgi:hypothetical protein